MRYAGVVGLVFVAAFPAAGGAQMPGATSQTVPSEAVIPPGVARNSLYQGVEYVSGHEGFDEKLKGQLAITANGLHFFDNMGRVVFALPMSTVRTAEHSRDIRDPSVGKKLLFGSLAGDRKQDFLTLTTETESMAEGIVFKVKQNIGTGMAAKINFYARKASQTVGGVAGTPALPADPDAATLTDTPAVADPSAEVPESLEETASQQQYASQASPPQPVLQDATGSEPGQPVGTHWVASLSQMMYYPATCSAVKGLKEADKLYYATEEAPARAGFKRSIVC